MTANRTGYNSSASLYGGDLSGTADEDLDSYWKKGANKKKKNKQNGSAASAAGAGQQAKKKQHKAHTPAGFTNLGYGLIDESTSLVFTTHRVTGRCQDLEKDYLRLTSQADPDRVRPPTVLLRALNMVKRKWIDAGDYEYVCNQLKAIRQDLTVQHIKDALTVEVYETHARIALESLDFQEFAQCQTQLQLLYKDGVTCGMERECEFAAYKILYSCLMTGPSDSGLASFMNSLSPEHKSDPAVQHALAVRSALLTTNFERFFTLWIHAPNMSAYIIDPLADSMRQRSARILVSAYRPTLSLEHITRALAFDRTEESEDNGAAASSVAATSSSARAAPLPAHLRSCRQYLDSKFLDSYGAPLFAWIKELPADGLGAPRFSIDCKTTHERLAPSNAQHRQPINSGRARHTVSSSSSSATAAAMSPNHAPIAPQHDVGMWIKKDLSGTVKLGAIEGSPSIKGKFSGSLSGGSGQPKAAMPRMSLAALSAANGSPQSSPSPSPPLSSPMHSSLSFARASASTGSSAAAAASSSKPGSSPMELADDPVSRKRRNSQPLSSMSYHELEAAIRESEAVLLDQKVKEKFDEFNLQLMMSRLKALQKQFKKTKKPK